MDPRFEALECVGYDDDATIGAGSETFEALVESFLEQA
jgi:hypothetical protein